MAWYILYATTYGACFLLAVYHGCRREYKNYLQQNLPAPEYIFPIIMAFGGIITLVFLFATRPLPEYDSEHLRRAEEAEALRRREIALGLTTDETPDLRP